MTTPQQPPAPPQNAPQVPPQAPAAAPAPAPAYAQQAPQTHQPQQPQHAQPSQQPGYWPGQAPSAGYVSHIPIRKATLTDALAAEWTKIRSVRSTMWTLGVMVLLIVGIGFLTAAVVAGAGDGELNNSSPLSLGFFGVLLGIICVVTLGVLTISSEYGTGMIRTTLTACPSRGRVLAAKAVVFFLLAFVITLVCTGLIAMVDSALLSDRTTFQPDADVWLRATLGVSLYVATLGLLGLAVGTLLRHSAGSITVMLGVILLPMVLSLFMMGEALSDVRKALIEYSIPMQLSAFYATGADRLADGPTGWDPLWIMLGVAAVALAGAYASLARRDA
ncbi:ABC transporter permease subunit [Streptomyces sp. NPDC053048]|uniref:ABC transporter permease subunit n=1 Tax=Streptomyces sp. NPDC053048 TaxID=3365694 RepID=UPI0037D1D6FA